MPILLRVSLKNLATSLLLHRQLKTGSFSFNFLLLSLSQQGYSRIPRQTNLVWNHIYLFFVLFRLLYKNVFSLPMNYTGKHYAVAMRRPVLIKKDVRVKKFFVTTKKKDYCFRGKTWKNLQGLSYFFRAARTQFFLYKKLNGRQQVTRIFVRRFGVFLTKQNTVLVPRHSFLLFYPTSYFRIGRTQSLFFSSKRYRLGCYKRLEKRAHRKIFRKLRNIRRKRITRQMLKMVSRRYRFVKKYRAFLKYTTLHTNMFFLAQQGTFQSRVTTGMFGDLRHGTKRKRTLLAGWFLADRLADLFEPQMHQRTVFFADFFGRTSGRRGVWYSWRTHNWRLIRVSSRTPIANNGTRGCRRRRL